MSEGYYCRQCRDTGKVDGSRCACQVAVQESFDRFQTEQYKLSIAGPVGWTHVSKERLSEEILQAMLRGTFGYCEGHGILYRRDKSSCPMAGEHCEEAKVREFSKDKAFALYKGLWHALEWSRCDGVFPVNKMLCGLEVRVTLEGMTSYGGDPKPIPTCIKCCLRGRLGKGEQ